VSTVAIEAAGLGLTVDRDTGQWLSLTGGRTNRSWLSPVAADAPGLPFLSGGPVDPGVLVPLACTAGETNATIVSGASRRGGCTVRLSSGGDHLVAEYRFPDRRGPRAGVHIPLDHLDLEFDPDDRSDRSHHLMPVCVATDEHFLWSYVVWHRSETDFLVLAVHGLHAGWRFLYSYPGHRIVGFRVLARADDVIAPPRFAGGRLPAVTHLRLKSALASSREDALAAAHRMVGLPVAEPALHPISDWNDLARRAVEFHLEHYQLHCGAFARSVSGDTLSPDRRATSGRHFGDPEEAGSCMTGEFGGFVGWAALLHQRLLPGIAIAPAVRRYFDWLLNRHTDGSAVGSADILPGTIWPADLSIPPAVTVRTGPKGVEAAEGGARPAPFHLWGVPHYAQYESWAVAQLADAVALGAEDLRAPLAGVLAHYLTDHVGEYGAVHNRRYTDDPQDYCTVDAPLVHILRAAEVLNESHPDVSALARATARGIAAHILVRGFSFPTEGEQSTEDGSIACAAWSLAYAFNELSDPDPAWLAFARDLLGFHRKFEMFGADARLNGSSVRFWETMYESDDWGPSINAGHAWTLWTAFAEWEMFRATGAYRWIEAAWSRTSCVASRVRDDGGMPVCFTPDPIPQIPHADVAEADDPGGPLGTVGYRREGEMTSVHAGNRYPQSLSASGMFLFVLAPKTWYSACGFHPVSGTAINAVVAPGRVTPLGIAPCTMVALASVPAAPLTIEGVVPGCRVRIRVDPEHATGLESVAVSGGTVVAQDGNTISVVPEGTVLTLEP
jgi:hypothetical protein